MKNKIITLVVVFFYIFLCSCEKEVKYSSGFGYNGPIPLSFGLPYWKINEVKIFSASKGVDYICQFHGGNIKSVKVNVIDTVFQKVLYERTDVVNDNLHYISDTFFLSNVNDTIFAKLSIEANDDDEMRIISRNLKIGK